MIRFTFAIWLSLTTLGVSAQQPALEGYIRQGLAANRALAQKQFIEQQQLEQLRQAKALFYPSLALNARYSVANGGRQIVLPLGDILNPVYSTLNALQSTAHFPQVSNQNIAFLRTHEQETKLSLSAPLFVPAIYFNEQLQLAQATITHLDVATYRRELVKEIKVAYFNYLSAVHLQTLYGQTRKLLEQNLKVSQALVANNKATVDASYRSSAEVSSIVQQLAEAENSYQVARAYFNFLLNEPLDEPITEEPDSLYFNSIPDSIPAIAVLDNAALQREELLQVQKGIDISDISIKLARSRYLPTVNALVEGGIQGSYYDFNQHPYGNQFIQASAVLSWTLFGGFQNRSKVAQARINHAQQLSRQSELKSQIGQQTRADYFAVEAARKSIIAAQARVSSAAKAYRIVAKQYEQGLVPIVQYTDARTSLTAAEESVIISRYTYLIRLANLERSTASYTFQ